MKQYGFTIEMQYERMMNMRQSGGWKRGVFIAFMAWLLCTPMLASDAMAVLCPPANVTLMCAGPCICPAGQVAGQCIDALFDTEFYCIPSSVPNCTADFTPPAPTAGQGIFSSIVTQVIHVLNNLSQNMFQGITGDAGFQVAVKALITLYIAIYGILFTFGMVQVTLFDFAIRLIKIGIVGMLVGGTNGWLFFSNIVIPFFQQSTYTIINWVTAIAVGPVAACSTVNANGQVVNVCTAPFAVLDNAITQAVSANMVVLLVTTVTTGPYGPLVGLLLLLATGTFLKMMINALWVYTMSLVMQALLFGLAPIFLAFLLFSRTKHLFDGWLNQLVNSLLQPVLLFTFLAFFVTLILACITTLTSNNICWTHVPATFNGNSIWEQRIFGGSILLERMVCSLQRRLPWWTGLLPVPSPLPIDMQMAILFPTSRFSPYRSSCAWYTGSLWIYVAVLLMFVSKSPRTSQARLPISGWAWSPWAVGSPESAAEVEAVSQASAAAVEEAAAAVSGAY